MRRKQRRILVAAASAAVIALGVAGCHNPGTSVAHWLNCSGISEICGGSPGSGAPPPSVTQRGTIIQVQGWDSSKKLCFLTVQETWPAKGGHSEYGGLNDSQSQCARIKVGDRYVFLSSGTMKVKFH